MSWNDGINPRQLNALRESYQKWPTLTAQVEKKLIRWGLLSEQIRNAYEHFRSEVTAEEVAKREESKKMLIRIMKQQKKQVSSSLSTRDVTKEDVKNIIRIVAPQVPSEPVKKADASIKSEPVETGLAMQEFPGELRDKRERRVPRRPNTPEHVEARKRGAQAVQTSEPPKKSVKIEAIDAEDVKQVDTSRVKMEVVESPEPAGFSLENCAPIQHELIRPQCSYETPEPPVQVVPQDIRPFTVSPNSAFSPYQKPGAPEQLPIFTEARQMEPLLQVPQLLGYHQLPVFQPVTAWNPPLYAGLPLNGLVEMIPQVPQPLAINFF